MKNLVQKIILVISLLGFVTLTACGQTEKTQKQEKTTKVQKVEKKDSVKTEEVIKTNNAKNPVDIDTNEKSKQTQVKTVVKEIQGTEEMDLDGMLDSNTEESLKAAIKRLKAEKKETAELEKELAELKKAKEDQ